MLPGPEVAGWEHPGEFERLAEWARRVDGPFLEIGSYCGRSTVHLGLAAREQNTVVFAVDHHRGSPEMAPGMEGHRPEVCDEQGRHDTLPHFRRTVAPVEEWVIPVVTSSRTLARHWNTPVGLLFIDADHSIEAVTADYREFSGWVRTDGYIAFHDSGDEGPRHAIGLAESDGWAVVDRFESLTVLQRKE